MNIKEECLLDIRKKINIEIGKLKTRASNESIPYFKGLFNTEIKGLKKAVSIINKELKDCK